MTLRPTYPIGDRRRGACMIVLDASHSDIYDFVTIKAERRGELSYFNLSLGVTDAFLHAVERTGAHHQCCFTPRRNFRSPSRVALAGPLWFDVASARARSVTFGPGPQLVP